MRLWSRDHHDVLLIDGATGDMVTAGDIQRLSADLSGHSAGLAFLFADQSLLSCTRFLAFLEAGIPVALFDAGMSPRMALDLVRRYRPEAVFVPDESSAIYSALPEGDTAPGGQWWSRNRAVTTPNPDLAVLLSTSGSTGSPKLVRLSRTNIVSNAQAIARSLALKPQDRGVTSLPLFYSFGMSLITSHIAAGSSVVVSSRSVIDRDFWSEIHERHVTHLAGVPQTYAMLKRLRFADRELPYLSALLQAGGRLDPELVADFAADSRRKGRRFFVMYGQTEASPRMACLPSDRLPEKLGSVGLALAGGDFSILAEGGRAAETGEVGEVVYSGPNVMLGYAESHDDLALGDECGGVLRTGDLGYLDHEGFLYITGRTKRIAKISGVRVSLDEVEAMLSSIAPVAVVAGAEDGIRVFTSDPNTDSVKSARKQLARDMGVALGLIEVHQISALPLMNSGKVDYANLNAWGADGGSTACGSDPASRER